MSQIDINTATDASGSSDGASEGTTVNPIVMDLTPPDLTPDDIPEEFQKPLTEAEIEASDKILSGEVEDDDDVEDDEDLDEDEVLEDDEDLDEDDEENEDDEDDEDDEDKSELDEKSLKAVKRKDRRQRAEFDKEKAAMAQEREDLDAIREELAPLAHLQQQIEVAAQNFNHSPMQMMDHLNISEPKDLQRISKILWVAAADALGDDVPNEWREETRRARGQAQQSNLQATVAQLEAKIESLEKGTDPRRTSRSLRRSLASAAEEIEDIPHIDVLLESNPDQAAERLVAKHRELMEVDGVAPDAEEVLEEVEADIVKELKKFGSIYSREESSKSQSKQNKKNGQKKKTRALSQKKTSSRTRKKKVRVQTEAQREEEALNVLRRGFGA